MIRLFSQSWGILLLLAAWQAWVTVTGFNAIVMPSPRMVFDDLAGQPMAYLAPSGATLLVAFVGAGCGFAVGIAMALASWMSRVLGGLLLPLGVIFSSIPVVCLIPILARVLGYGEQTVGAIVAVLTFFPAFVYTSGGLRAAPPMTSELFSVYGARRVTVLLRLALPAALPNMMIALRIGAAQSIIAAMIGEFLMGATGLGHLFVVTHQNLQMDRAVGAALVVAAISASAYGLTAIAEARVRDRWS
jgi:ABC-type nitrate/sulfonate/bicarbonate transport system permease component